MGWRERYRQARFRKASFFVSNAEARFGRRAVQNEFPNVDRPFAQDMGRRARSYTVNGYLLGDDYMEQRDLLIAECEKEGPGLLVHPYYGTLSVLCADVSFSDDKNVTRMVRFSATFIEGNILLETPMRSVNTGAALLSARSAALRAMQDAFLTAYSVARKPLAVINKVKSTIDSAVGAVDDFRRIVKSQADYARAVLDVADSVADLALSPADLVNDWVEILQYGTTSTDNFFEATRDNAIQQFEEIQRIFDNNEDDKDTLTEEGFTDEDDPSVVFAHMVEQSSTIVQAGLLEIMQFESVNQAEDISGRVLDKIDDMQGATLLLADEVFESFDDLRATIVAHIEERSASLSRLVVTSIPEDTPALVLSNTLYGSTDEEQDLIDRNKVKHPGFVPANQPLEVLLSGTE